MAAMSPEIPTKSTAIPLHSPEGQQLLTEVTSGPEYGFCQPILLSIFSKQTSPAGCGMQSAALLLSANLIGQQKIIGLANHDPRRGIPFTESIMFENVKRLGVTSREVISRRGSTLKEVSDMIAGHGFVVERVHVVDSTEEKFRNDVIRAVSHSDSMVGILVNFNRSYIWPLNHHAHHSPVAAYHKCTDRILLMDTSQRFYETWIPVSDMFRGMNTWDRSVKNTENPELMYFSRGYCVVSSPEEQRLQTSSLSSSYRTASQ